MSLIANGELAATNAMLIGDDDFFPMIDVGRVRDFVRADGSVTDERFTQIVAEEILDVQYILEPLVDKVRHINDLAKLTDLSKRTIEGKSDVEVWYFSAVANGVGAKIVEKYRNYDSTAKVFEAGKGAELDAIADDYRRNKMWALAKLQGRNQTVVELI